MIQTWESPSGVTHTFEPGRPCFTCGRGTPGGVHEGAESKRYCTKPEHQDGEHDASCMPPADPASPELRRLRAIFGLCPDCDRTEPHEHLRARAGEPCPDGCTTGYGREEKPVLVERACDSPGMREGLAPGEEPEDDGERLCPVCWGYMGNEIAGRMT